MSTVMMQVMKRIENVMKEAEYTQKKVPLQWLAFIDDIKEKEKSFFELSEFTSIAVNECGERVGKALATIQSLGGYEKLILMQNQSNLDMSIGGKLCRSEAGQHVAATEAAAAPAAAAASVSE